MIARCRRLERLRTRQHDQARGVALRAQATAAGAALAVTDAEQRYLAAATGEPTVAQLEQAMRCVDASVGQSVSAERAAAAANVRALASARAWQRADAALAQARDRQDCARHKAETREQDEHAARRTR